MYTEGAPRYVVAMSTNSAFAVVGIALTLAMRLALVRSNKRLAAAESAAENELPKDKDESSDEAPQRGSQPDAVSFRYAI